MAQFLPDIMIDNNPRKFYGEGAGGFTKGMNTTPFSGVGFQVLENMEIENGELEKMFGETLLTDIEDIEEVARIEEFVKTDGTSQLIVFYSDGTNYKVKAIEEDGTVVTPTDDVDFTNATFGYTQITTNGYISTNVSTGTSIYKWDGVTLTALTNAPQNVTSIGNNGRRIIAIADGIVSGSRADNNPVTSWTGGSAENVELEFRTNLNGLPVGAYSSNIGTSIGFTNGFELHNVFTVSDGVGGLIVDSETREKLFKYNGRGLKNEKMFVFGAFYGYALTEIGLIRIDPTSGSSLNLMGEEGKNKAGAIANYFKTFALDNAQVSYDQNQKMIVFTCSTSSTGVNDTLVMYNEQTGNFNIRKGYYRSLTSLNGDLYGGRSIDGKIVKLFDKTNYSDFNGEFIRTRAISEWDTLGTMHRLKLPQEFLAFVNGHSETTITLKLYTDGNVNDPVATFTYTPEDMTDSSFITDALGSFTLGIGNADDQNNSDEVTKDEFNIKFNSYCWEISEESNQPFIIRDFELEYLNQEEIVKTASFANKLFTI